MSENLKQGIKSSRLKIVRANRHIHELETIILEYPKIYKQQGLTIISKSNGSVSLDIVDLNPLGDFICLALGDAIHNLRSALDHLWSTLMREADVTSSKNLATFPFHKTRKNLEDLIKKSPVIKAYPKVEQLIFEKVKPHSDDVGNHFLWALTKLDKLDKHNMIIPIFKVSKATGIEINMAGNNTISIGTFEGKSILETNMPFDFNHEGEVFLEVFFPEDNELAGKPVLESMKMMTKMTEEVIEVFSSELV